MTPLDPVFLLGMPRSGTTWLSQIFESHGEFTVRLSPNYSYSLRHRLGEDSDAEEWRRVLAAAAASADPFLTQNWQRERGNLPRFDRRGRRLAIKDTRFHSVYLAGMDRLADARCIYLVRHPLAVLDSWRRSPEFPPGAAFADEWRHGRCRKMEGPGEYWGFDDWCDLTRSYRRRAAEEPDRFRVVRFEDLVDDPEGVATGLFTFAGATPTDSVRAFLAESHRRHDDDPYSVFKQPRAVRDGWRNRIEPHIAAEVAGVLAGTELAEYLT